MFFLPIVLKIDLFVRGAEPFDRSEFARRVRVPVGDHGELYAVGPEDNLLREVGLVPEWRRGVRSTVARQRVWVLRKVLTTLSPTEAMELLLSKVGKARSSGEFLAAMAAGKS